MNWWITIALMGCTNKAPTPCSPGDGRDDHDRCDSGSPSDTADIDPPDPDPSTDDTSEPTDDTGELPPTPDLSSRKSNILQKVPTSAEQNDPKAPAQAEVGWE